MSLWGPFDPATAEEAEAAKKALEAACKNVKNMKFTPEELADLRAKIEERAKPYRTKVSMRTLLTILD